MSRYWWRDGDPDFDRTLPHIRVQGGGKNGRVTPRLELPSPPPIILNIALGLKKPCVDCGRPVNVFRDRTVGYPGGAVKGNTYLSVLCERPSCTKGHWRIAYRDLVDYIEKSRPPQASFFGGTT